MSATISEIARRAGVTHTTVSRILSGKYEPKYRSAIKRARQVRHIADELGYRPNAAARATASGRFDAVAMLIGSVTPRYLPAELVYAAERSLAADDKHLVFAGLTDDRLVDEGYVPKVLQQLSVDGLLIHYTHRFPEKMRELIETHRIPSIWINTKLPTDCVYLDDLGAAHDATRRLLALGHRRIAYVNFHVHGHYSEADRRAGYERAMREAGLSPRVVEPPAWEGAGRPAPDGRLAAARQLLAPADRPTAVLCYETTVAGPIVHAAAGLNLRIPDDLSVIKFGRYEHNDTGVPLSTICTSLERVGQLAVAMLEKKIAQPDEATSARPLQMPMLGNATLAPPPDSINGSTNP